MITDEKRPNTAEQKQIPSVNFVQFWLDIRQPEFKSKHTDAKEINIFVPAFQNDKLYKKTYKSKAGFSLKSILKNVRSCVRNAIKQDMANNPDNYGKEGKLENRIIKETDRYALNYFFQEDNNYYFDFVPSTIIKHTFVRTDHFDYSSISLGRLNNELKVIKDTDKKIINDKAMHVHYYMFGDYHIKKFKSGNGFTLADIVRAIHTTGLKAFTERIQTHPEDFRLPVTAEECLKMACLYEFKIKPGNQIHPGIEY
jgi:hypothetical protein